MTSMIGTIVQFPVNLYKSPDLTGERLLTPSKYVHNHLWNDLSKASTGKKVLGLISDIFVQILLSPLTGLGCCVKLCEVPALLQYNARQRPKDIDVDLDLLGLVHDKAYLGGSRDPSEKSLEEMLSRPTTNGEKSDFLLIERSLSSDLETRKSQCQELRREIFAFYSETSRKLVYIKKPKILFASKREDSGEVKIQIGMKLLHTAIDSTPIHKITIEEIP